MTGCRQFNNHADGTVSVALAEVVDGVESVGTAETAGLAASWAGRRPAANNTKIRTDKMKVRVEVGFIALLSRRVPERRRKTRLVGQEHGMVNAGWQQPCEPRHYRTTTIDLQAVEKRKARASDFSVKFHREIKDPSLLFSHLSALLVA
jgi:hypothetical protein